jgi:phage shock protein C
MKRLVKGERMIWGVCSGIANYMELDPTVIRIAFVASVLLFGTGILLYIILALLMPSS